MLISYSHKLPGAYDFYIHHYKKVNNKDLLKEHKFRFTTRKNRTYIVDVEEYIYNVYAIKFYLKACSLSRNRYRMLANDFDGFRVISTLVAIVLHIHATDQNASFGFIGTPILNKEESANNTKRFKVYQNLAKKYFSPETFDHGYNIDNSSYLLLNKKSIHNALKEKIEDMFNRLYIGI